MKKPTALGRLLTKKDFVYMPVAYDPLGERLLQRLGFDCVYTGGFVTGASRCTSEPLLTMDEQLRVAGDVAAAIDIPLVVDGGAGFGEPLHTMRTVRECIRAGIAGVHIEDQLYPKRAHYHKYVAHAVPRKEFAAKIALAYREIKRSGGYTGLSNEECVAARHEIETLVGLDAFYEIEEETVEKK